MSYQKQKGSWLNFQSFNASVLHSSTRESDDASASSESPLYYS